MQLHDILQLRTSVILPEAISDGGLTPTTDTSLFLTTYRGGSHLPSDIPNSIPFPMQSELLIWSYQLYSYCIPQNTKKQDIYVLFVQFKNAPAFLLRGARHAIA